MKTSIYAVASEIPAVDNKSKAVMKERRGNSQTYYKITEYPSVIEPEAAPNEKGLHLLTPAMAASLAIDVLHIDQERGTMSGYQREVRPVHARRIARSMRRGDWMPPVLYTVGPDGPEVVDGQHRLIACLISGEPIWAVAFPLSKDERVKLFANQRKAVSVPAATLILNTEGPMRDYLLDALTSDTHPWSNIVGEHGGLTKVPVATTSEIIVSYMTKRMGTGTSQHMHNMDMLKAVWNSHTADELGMLISTFGTKQANPVAFTAHALRGITQAAVLIVRQRGSNPRDVKRWQEHMAKFDWRSHAHLRKATDIRDALIRHWNLRLAAKNRVMVDLMLSQAATESVSEQEVVAV